MIFKKFTAILIALILTATGVFAENSPVETEIAPMAEDGEMAKTLVTQAANFILQRYKFDVERAKLYEDTLMKLIENHPELTEEAFKAMYSGLDDHSSYYTQKEYDYFLEDMSGEFSGIGVVITALEEGLLVTDVQANSSASECGIKQGDLIISANGTDIRGMPIEQARTYIIGEIGTVVTVGIIRNGEYIEVYATRKPVIVEPGMFQILENKIGYLRLDTFDGSAPALINHALDVFDTEGITNIIFDVRSNPGGAVTSLVEICQRLIPEGPVIHFEYKNPLKNTSLHSMCKDAKYSIIVLANEHSASASEAFCGAVQDSGVGIVVGTTTYGKGTMQNLTDFKTGGGVKLTTAEYLTRNKRHINEIGIEPDEYVEDKFTTLKNSGYADLDFDTVMKFGDKGETVLALNQRLWAMGFDIGIPTDIYSEKTQLAVYNFQRAMELYPYGVCDITTQLEIENTLQEAEIPDDKSFKVALEIFKTNTIDEYKTDYSVNE